jgi:hypothetical protein
VNSGGAPENGGFHWLKDEPPFAGRAAENSNPAGARTARDIAPRMITDDHRGTVSR